jgi:hypothetical protein
MVVFLCCTSVCCNNAPKNADPSLVPSPFPGRPSGKKTDSEELYASPDAARIGGGLYSRLLEHLMEVRSPKIVGNERCCVEALKQTCACVQATADPSPVVATAAKAALDAAELPVPLLRVLLAAAADNQPRYKKPHHSRTQPTSNAQASASPQPMGTHGPVHTFHSRGHHAGDSDGFEF